MLTLPLLPTSHPYLFLEHIYFLLNIFQLIFDQARNVLIDSTLKAKVSDFGLSCTTTNENIENSQVPVLH